MFRAFDPETERLVAVKLFTLDLPPERVHQLVAELDRLIAAALTHPGIAAPLAAGIRDNRAYLAMEYVSADSLDVAVRQYGAAPPADALRVAAQLAGALDFAAVVNITHGALHPRDVLLSPEETRLTGLGIAQAFETVNVAAPVRRPYTPPEGIAGAEWDRRADVFSLAALMHELLWGRRLSATGAQAAASLTDLPGANLGALRALFARALAVRSADRFDTALQFAQALTEAFPDVTIAAPPPSGATSIPALPLEGAAVESEPGLPLEAVGADLRVGPDGHTGPSLHEPVAAADVRPVKKAVRARPEPPVVRDEAGRVEEVPLMVRPSQTGEAPRRDVDPADLDLRQAEAPRYEEVEPAPAILDVPPVRPDLDAPADAPPGLISGYADAPISALERSRSAIWPLALALLVGGAIGFAGGYGVGSRDRSTSPQAIADLQIPAAPAATVGRESTDDSASQPPKPASDAAKSDAAAPQPTGVTGRSTSSGAPAAPVAPKSETGGTSSGRLLVRSTPAGARVFVDGREEGRTPVAVRELGRGEHRVRVVHDGYATEERRVTVTASRPAQSMTVPLLRARVAPAPASATPLPATPGTTGRFVGALTVDSRPPGAQVFIDGKLEGTTPLQLAGLNAGEHVVRIERDGYRRWSSSVRVVASEQNRVTASLEK